MSDPFGGWVCGLLRYRMLALLVLSVQILIGCHTPAIQPLQSPWNALKPGDYLRKDYIKAVQETRSPWKAWQIMEATDRTGVESITIGRDNRNTTVAPGYNFHEGSGVYPANADGSMDMDDERYAVHVIDSERFVVSSGKSTIEFRYVGNMDRWSNQMIVAGNYLDDKGQRYEFSSDGQAHFPGNQTFDYSVGLDMILTDYDYIYSSKVDKTWSIKLTKNGIDLYDVAESDGNPEGVVAKKPRWRLKRVAGPDSIPLR